MPGPDWPRLLNYRGSMIPASHRVTQRTVTEHGESSMSALNRRELATVLAALRYYQHDLEQCPSRIGSDINEIATNVGELAPLTVDEIDTLCEELNTSGDDDDDGEEEKGETWIAGQSCAYDGKLSYSDRDGLVRMPDGSLDMVRLGLNEEGGIPAVTRDGLTFGRVVVSKDDEYVFVPYDSE